MKRVGITTVVTDYHPDRLDYDNQVHRPHTNSDVSGYILWYVRMISPHRNPIGVFRLATNEPMVIPLGLTISDLSNCLDPTATHRPLPMVHTC